MRILLLTIVLLVCSVMSFAQETQQKRFSVKEPNFVKKDAQASVKPYDIHGYNSFLEIGYMPGLSGDDMEGDMNKFTLTTTQGYQINNHLFAGVGIGVMLYSYGESSDEGGYTAYGDVRYNIFDKRMTPYLDIKVGGVMNMGVMSEISAGYRFGLPRRGRAFYAQMTFNMQKYELGMSFSGVDISQDFSIRNLGFKVGFEW